MTILKFSKMHGLGNDFMVVDAINQDFKPEKAPLTAWADRHTGVGFDQFLLVERATDRESDFRYRIFNADGSEVEQCGNGARCFVKFVVEKGLSKESTLKVQTAKGVITPHLNDDGTVTVDMGQPRFLAAEVPFVLRAGEQENKKSYIVVNGIDAAEMSIVGMGNPHAVMWVENVDTAPVEAWGAALQRHPRFPERVNVGFMQIVDKHHMRLRVYERGTGETLACGSGACAAVVAGIRLGLLAAGEPICVQLAGGELSICWQENESVLMTGMAVKVFDGELIY